MEPFKNANNGGTTNGGSAVPQNDTAIKVTGEPQTYGENGAKRNSAKGKGRFDLIPTEPFRGLIMRLKEGGTITCTKEAITAAAFEDRIYDTIIALTIYAYDRRTCAETPLQEYQVHDFVNVFNDMLIDLARHFEKGAEIYGERNCQRGIPAWRFRDSGLRHLNQYFAGLDDEPHLISAIWNFWMLVWTYMTNYGENSKTAEQINGNKIKDRVNKLCHPQQENREDRSCMFGDIPNDLNNVETPGFFRSNVRSPGDENK